jgi:hypothetical protein
MKHIIRSINPIIISLACASAQVRVDEEVFGKSLGGWTKRAADGPKLEIKPFDTPQSGK